jgi:hypothetical protein
MRLDGFPRWQVEGTVFQDRIPAVFLVSFHSRFSFNFSMAVIDHAPFSHGQFPHQRELFQRHPSCFRLVSKGEKKPTNV